MFALSTSLCFNREETGSGMLGNAEIKRGPTCGLECLECQGRKSVYMPCKMTSTESHRKAHSLDVPREKIPF